MGHILWASAQWGPHPAPLPSSSCRVKSEAIIAHREPKEEVEDVSSYLCTELVYSTINMWAWGVGSVGGLPGDVLVLLGLWLLLTLPV